MWFLIREGCYAMRFGDTVDLEKIPPTAVLLVKVWTNEWN
jgi:hypothetical protein